MENFPFLWNSMEVFHTGIHVCYKLNDFNLTSTESDFLRSPLDEVIEVAPPQGKLLFLTISAKPAYP